MGPCSRAYCVGVYCQQCPFDLRRFSLGPAGPGGCDLCGQATEGPDGDLVVQQRVWGRARVLVLWTRAKSQEQSPALVYRDGKLVLSATIRCHASNKQNAKCAARRGLPNDPAPRLPGTRCNMRSILRVVARWGPVWSRGRNLGGTGKWQWRASYYGAGPRGSFFCALGSGPTAGSRHATNPRFLSHGGVRAPGRRCASMRRK